MHSSTRCCGDEWTCTPSRQRFTFLNKLESLQTPLTSLASSSVQCPEFFDSEGNIELIEIHGCVDKHKWEYSGALFLLLHIIVFKRFKLEFWIILFPLLISAPNLKIKHPKTLLKLTYGVLLAQCLNKTAKTISRVRFHQQIMHLH